jgi:threonine synthase
MENWIGFRCSSCCTEYGPDEVTYTCPKDQGNLDVVLSIHSLKSHLSPTDIVTSLEPSLWRYLPLLPIGDPGFMYTPLHSAGWTPMYRSPVLSQNLGLRNMWIKDESRNPTASFKDRASAIVVSKGISQGVDVIVTASTGNAGAALAGMSAAVNQRAVIFAPRSAPPAKVAQLLVYGAQVFLVDGNYDDAFDLSIQAAHEFGWYCRNTGYNPFTAEGKKTAAYEIYEFMLQQRHLPPGKASWSVFVSVGDGNIISGIYKGFKDLVDLEWLPEIPRLFGVQAEGSAAITNTYNLHASSITPVQANTIADSISVDIPRDGMRAVRSIRSSQGAPILVSDAEILSAIAELGKVGIFAEPAGAASYAGLCKAVNFGLIGPDDPVIVINTGNGLKDVKAAIQSVGQARIIEPTLEAVKKVVK